MTRKLESMVVAVDFGNASANAVALAGRIAAACGAPAVQLLHAEQFDVPPYFTPEQIGALDREREVARAQANDYLRGFGQAHTPQPFTTRVIEGPAVDVILQASQGSDLLVMGTHGRRGVSRWWLGSVAERVLRASTRPVLVVHEAGLAMPDEPRVLVAAGDGRDDAVMREYGQALASCLHGHWSVAPPGDLPGAAAADDAGLIVTRSPWPDGDPLHVHRAEQLLRVCTRPVFFVPGL